MKKVLLITMSTAAAKLFTVRTAAALKRKSLSAEITAMNAENGLNNLDNFDMVLLAPHKRFLLNKPSKLSELNDKPVEVVDSRDFANLNGEAAANLIEQMMHSRKY